MGQLITRIRLTQRWLFILFALCNGGLVLLLQHVSSGYTTLTIVTLISAAIVPEVALVCRGRAWPYFNIYWMSALQLQCAYIFSCAIVNLSMSALWAAGTSLHRYGIFSLTMFFTAELSCPLEANQMSTGETFFYNWAFCSLRSLYLV